MESSNAIAKLCVAGMEAEGRGDPAEALGLFMNAWNQSQSPWEACIAAHYVARHQPTPQDGLGWNLKALELAQEVADGSTVGFFPSLLLNIAHSYEELGQLHEAGLQYDLAAKAAEELENDGYGRYVRMGIEAGRQRVIELLAKGSPSL
jgi:hypothetical protein